MDNRQIRSWHRLTLIAVAAVGIGISAVLASHFFSTQIETRRHQLTIDASILAEELGLYLHSREMIARTVGALFKAPGLSEPYPLGSIGKKVLALTPEIIVMAWIPQVEPSRIHEVLNAFSAAGLPPRLFGPDFQTLDDAVLHRPLYPVVDVEPKSEEHKAGLGMEVSLFPSRRAAFERARDERRVIATAPVGLLQPFNTAGYILYSPVYDERGFVGSILFAFRVDQLLHGFADGRRIPMNFHVYDATDPAQLTHLIGITRQGEIEPVDLFVHAEEANAVRQSLDFAGRKMLLLFEPGPDLVRAGLQQGLMVGILGLILTGLVLWGMDYFMRSSQRLAAEIATTNLMKVSLELANRELVHRVGNLLAVAQGIVALSYKASLSAAEFRDSVIARLSALSQSVGLINRKDWTGVWLHELLQTEFAPVADRINISGRDALLKPQAAQSLSLLFYELMTNSSKHGALSKREGTVAAGWEIQDSDSGRLFCFRWQEHDPEIVQPARHGFGTKLLTRLVPGDLSGRATLNFEPGWFRYDLQAPAERIVEQEATAAVTVKAAFPPRAARGHLGLEKLSA